MMFRRQYRLFDHFYNSSNTVYAIRIGGVDLATKTIIGETDD